MSARVVAVRERLWSAAVVGAILAAGMALAPAARAAKVKPSHRHPVLRATATSDRAPVLRATATSDREPVLRATPTPASKHQGDPSGPARNQLISLVQNAAQAAASVYGATDSTGLTVDTIKIVPSPAGGYLGVYHHILSNGTFQVRLAVSSDLLHWTYTNALDQGASQPTIAQLSDGSFLVVDEKNAADGTSHLHFADYLSLATLELGVPAAVFDAPLSLSSSHEGTPNVRSAAVSSGLSNSQIEIGFHYYDSSVGGDREAIGKLKNFSNWTATPNTPLNNAFTPTPPTIGDRDFINFEGYPFTVVEAQLVSGDWTSWRVFLYDETAKSLTQLKVATAGGSRSFANPALTSLTDPAGRRALVVSYFLPYQGAASGEAGPLIFYTEY